MSDAAEIKRRMDELQKTIVALTEAMKLRQWCVERAIEALAKGSGGHVSVVTLSAQIHGFIYEPAAQAIEQAKVLV